MGLESLNPLFLSQVVMEAVDDSECVLPDAICYYHDGKPRPNEVVRVVLGVEQYRATHLRSGEHNVYVIK